METAAECQLPPAWEAPRPTQLPPQQLAWEASAPLSSRGPICADHAIDEYAAPPSTGPSSRLLAQQTLLLGQTLDRIEEAFNFSVRRPVRACVLAPAAQ